MGKTAAQLRMQQLNDFEWIQELREVTDPREALRVIVDNEGILGGNPYVSDLVRALVEMAERLGAPE